MLDSAVLVRPAVQEVAAQVCTAIESKREERRCVGEAGKVDDSNVEPGVRAKLRVCGWVGIGGDGGWEAELVQGCESLFLNLEDIVLVCEADNGEEFVEGGSGARACCVITDSKNREIAQVEGMHIGTENSLYAQFWEQHTK